MMTLPRLLRVVSPSLFIVLGFAYAVVGQTETATVSGLVTDRTGATVPRAEVRLQSVERGTVTTTTTNDAGIYVFPSVHPGQYQISVHKQGFKQVDLLGLIVNVQDHIEQNFHLEIGSVAESVTVEAGAPLINTTDAAVSTVVDRNFAENLPMNGRSFQTLIQLTPGVVLTANNGADTGQFSVNGQRATSNYWMVDGVSANVGIGTNSPPSNGLAGSLGSFSVLGGTNSLVSVDALQEFRIQSSTYAPEFGRTPGGQISIVTRSGANQFHGTVFDYFRNDVLDANDWFANSKGLPKPQERQNDFGGTFSGPLWKQRTFFFFSYEGLRLRLPQTKLTNVPDVNARSSAVPGIQPFLKAYPLPNGSDNVSTGVAQFNASFSNPATLNAYSVRIDHRLSSKWAVFGRYNYSPSELDARGFGVTPLSTVYQPKTTIQTGTVGLTWSISTMAVNDFRFNYSDTSSPNSFHQDSFGGAVPLASLPFPMGFSAQNSSLSFVVLSLGAANGGFLLSGDGGTNVQRQLNVVDSLSLQKSSHGLKFGVDLRRLAPQESLPNYAQTPIFLSVPGAESGKTLVTTLFSRSDANLLFRNLGVFAQDTWRVSRRFTLTYGLRWDFDFTPSSRSGPSLRAVTGFDLSNLANLALAPAGTPPYQTTYGNVAPRIGLAYQLSRSQDWQTILRGGFGVFYDLATSEVGNILGSNSYPFGVSVPKPGVSFPLGSGTDAPPPITPPSPGTGRLFALDPHLELPYTLQWNAALEQALGRQQTLTASYVGSSGKRLIQTANISSPNPNYVQAVLVTNTATSNYNALQLQFQRRLSYGLQALASYTWSHSIDTASAGSIGNGSNDLTALNPSVNRGPSDFDIRNAFSAGLTYDVPVPKMNAFTNAILRGWSLQSVIQARSAPPVDLFYSTFSQLSSGFAANVRPDEFPGIPLYLFGPQFPGGKAFNSTLGAVAGGCPDGSQSIGPFCPPPTDAKRKPLRQGNLGRNKLRAFGATQWDFGIHRGFPIHESLRLQFRAEMFNVLNHPNFGPPVADISDPRFGQSIQMLGQSLSGSTGLGAGAFDPLYQIGGPRSIQLALKLTF